ncbi:MAG: hypothetical protein K0S93_160 [Nitrososphaeraceae archaeon]|jgi:hypothetical protein|nr:hypothetical protein [Nitrososphaeraceae archaeon]
MAELRGIGSKNGQPYEYHIFFDRPELESIQDSLEIALEEFCSPTLKDFLKDIKKILAINMMKNKE